MKPVAKYNTCKALSTVLTVGTPIATMACCSDMFVHRSDTALSAAAVFAFLLSALFIKDKILNFIKAPSALVISIIGFVFCVVVGNIIDTLRIVFGITMLACITDELTFKRMYNAVIYGLPENYVQFEKFGFLFTHSSTLLPEEVNNDQSSKQS